MVVTIFTEGSIFPILRRFFQANPTSTITFTYGDQILLAGVAQPYFPPLFGIFDGINRTLLMLISDGNRSTHSAVVVPGRRPPHTVGHVHG